MIHHDFGADVGKVLDIVINSIYTNKEIFLRELISNASDACEKLRHISLVDQDITLIDSDLKIIIRVDSKKGELSIEDNGIGMTKEELISNLGTIANSGTQRFLDNMSDAGKKNSNQIGKFGVGFYSIFIVASKASVYSRSYKSDSSYVWRSNGKDGFDVIEYSGGDFNHRGTKVVLTIKDEEIEFLDKHRIKHIISIYSDHIPFPIDLEVDDNSVSEVINKGKALWLREKSSITEDEYNKFYSEITHLPGKPWIILHNKFEGKVEYTSLVFIPNKASYGVLLQDNKKSGIKLYVQRVFISEDITILPQFLRFVSGVVDSSDISLNISRETLQNDQIVSHIRMSLTKRILKEIKTKAQHNSEEFIEFWNNLGGIIKEGLCDHGETDKESILEICKFYSSKSGDNLITIDEYISNMLDKQDQIFFITGVSVESIKRNPQIEGFVRRDIEVLFFKDDVDEFWTNVVYQYKGKEFRQVNRGEINLDNIKKLERDSDDVYKKNDENSDRDTEHLIDFFKKTLGNRVKNVVISRKLIDNPACISVPEDGMNTVMERILIERKQLRAKSPKLLEINPNNLIILEISKLSQCNEQNKQDEAKKLVEVVFLCARMVSDNTDMCGPDENPTKDTLELLSQYINERRFLMNEIRDS